MATNTKVSHWCFCEHVTMTIYPRLLHQIKSQLWGGCPLPTFCILPNYLWTNLVVNWWSGFWEASQYKGKHAVNDPYSRCSESSDPRACADCGCDNCETASHNQTFNSTLTVAVKGNPTIDCISEQKYHQHDYSIIRRTFNIHMTSEFVCCCFMKLKFNDVAF